MNELNLALDNPQWLMCQFFAAHRPSYLTKRFQALIPQSNDFIPHLCLQAFVRFGPLERFDIVFASSTGVFFK